MRRARRQFMQRKPRRNPDRPLIPGSPAQAARLRLFPALEMRRVEKAK